MHTIRIGELFAGYSGLGMGVKAAIGGEVAWVSEIDKGACKVLAHRFPDAPNLGDVTRIQWLPRCGEPEEFPRGCGNPMPIAEDRRGWVCDRCGHYWSVEVGRVYWPHVPEPVEVATASPRFEEWMMGLPDGWITDVPGVTWQEAVRMCGNGVVPQQAEAAVRWLLSVSERAA